MEETTIETLVDAAQSAGRPIILQTVEQKAAEPTPGLSQTQSGGFFLLGAKRVDAHGQELDESGQVVAAPTVANAEIERLRRQSEESKAEIERVQLDAQAEIQRVQEAARLALEQERKQERENFQRQLDEMREEMQQEMQKQLSAASAQTEENLDTSNGETPVAATELTELFGSSKPVVSLLKAGFDAREKLKLASDQDLLALDDFGDKSLEKLREWLKG